MYAFKSEEVQHTGVSAIKEESKVANRDWVDHQAFSLLQYINVIANLKYFNKPLDLQTDSHLLPGTLMTALRGPVSVVSEI